MEIQYLTPQYYGALKEMIQALREHIVSLETWEDDMIIYDTSMEAGSTISAFEGKENCIFIALNEGKVCGYTIGRIRKDNSRGSQIEYFGSVGQLFVDSSVRGKGTGKALLSRIEQEFLLFGASHIVISVFAKNIEAYDFYKHYGFEQRLISFGKRIN